MSSINILPGLLVSLLLANGNAGAAPPAGAKATAFCTKLQSSLQPSVSVPLNLFTAEDSSSDEFHAGEPQYVHCQFRQSDGSLIDVGLHDDTDGLFDDAAKQGYAPLTGSRDKGRYTVRGSAGQKWLDVVHGKIACEARFALEDDGRPLNREWKEVGTQVCDAAFSLHL